MGEVVSQVLSQDSSKTRGSLPVGVVPFNYQPLASVHSPLFAGNQDQARQTTEASREDLWILIVHLRSWAEERV